MRPTFNFSRGLIFITVLSSSLLSASCGDSSSTIRKRSGRAVVKTPDFGGVQIATTRTQSLIIENTGDLLLTIQSVTVTGGDVDAITVLNKNGAKGVQIPTNDKKSLDVKFAPNEVKSYTLKLRITLEGVPEPVDAEIKGEGVTTSLTISPKTVDFDNVKVNTTKEIPITLTNNSDVDATLKLVPGDNSWGCDEELTTPFCVGDETELHLNAGQSQTITAQYRPTHITASEGNFVIKACANEACAQTIGLTGNGVETALICTPSPLIFGGVNPGSQVTKMITCENIASDSLTIKSWMLQNGTHPAIKVAPPAQRTLARGQKIDIPVTFRPATVGSYSALLLVQNTDGSDIQVPIHGGGGGPDIQVTPARLNFGLVSTIAPSRKTLIIQNLGLEPLQISDMVFSDPSYSVVGEKTRTIAPKGLEQVTVEFKPTREGDLAGTLIIHSNDTDEPELSVRLSGEGIETGSCDFTIRPADGINFQAVMIDRTRTLAFDVINNATAEGEICIVTAARMMPDAPPEFSLAGGEVISKVLQPGAALTIMARFAPAAAQTYSGQLEFSISNETTPHVTVPLEGVGVSDSILISPDQLVFGTIEPNCSARPRTVTIYNTGVAAATISEVTLTGATGEFEIQNLPAVPFTIPATKSQTFDVVFRPTGVSDYSGSVEISGVFKGQAATYVIGLSGTGALDAHQVDMYKQLGTSEVDILFVIDYSGSMAQEQKALATNFAHFIKFAQQQSLDYHIGATTMDKVDNGKLCPMEAPPHLRVVTPLSVTPESVFKDVVKCVGGGDSATEVGLQTSMMAFSPPTSNTHNANLLRTDAVLAVVYVSDEPDHSAGPVSYWIDFLRSIKGFTRKTMFTASAITAPPNADCTGPGGNADAAPRYVEVAKQTNGVWHSICDSDWAKGLEKLGQTAFGFKSSFMLTQPARSNTIEVEVNGVKVPAMVNNVQRWRYDPTSYSIVFEPASVPEKNEEIVIRYATECTK